MSEQNDKVKELLGKSDKSTGGMSTMKHIMATPEAKEILEMGKSAVPAILENIEEFAPLTLGLLAEIVGNHPVKPSNYGKIDETIRDWREYFRYPSCMNFLESLFDSANLCPMCKLSETGRCRAMDIMYDTLKQVTKNFKHEDETGNKGQDPETGGR